MKERLMQRETAPALLKCNALSKTSSVECLFLGESYLDPLLSQYLVLICLRISFFYLKVLVQP